MFLIIFSGLLTVWIQNVGAECPTIINKKEWDGEKAKHVQYLSTPVDLVIIQHTVTQSCSNDRSCLTTVRDIQKTHMNTAFLWDIGPSFLIANTGKIYEGRGWHYVAVHTYGYNNQSVGIAFIGNFNNQEPSAKALNAARALIQCGVEEDYLSENHKVVVHSQLLPTESPGKKLASKVMTWPDWQQDVTEIKKRVDTQEFNDSPNTQVTTETTVRPSEGKINTRHRRAILSKPKEIDLLSNSRDIIAELIDNIRNLAKQTLDTVESLIRGLARQVSLFYEQLTAGLRRQKDRINTAVNSISLIPGLDQCTTPIQDRANDLYDETELTVKACADRRIREVDNMIKNLGTLSNNAINFSNTAVEETRNCTELNYGIKSTTEACLNSVTRQTRSATQTYKSQKTLALDAIKTALDALPAALDLCAKKNILDAGTKTTRMISQITSCTPSLLPGLGLFGQ